MLSWKLSFMSVRDPVTLNIFTVGLFIVSQTSQYIVLTVECFCLRRKSLKDKRVAITFHKNQRLISIIKMLHRKSLESWISSKNHITYETIKEEQMKYSRTVKVLDMVFCLIPKQKNSYWKRQETAANSSFLWNPKNCKKSFKNDYFCSLKATSAYVYMYICIYVYMWKY